MPQQEASAPESAARPHLSGRSGLSDLVAAGLDTAGVVFGIDGRPVSGARLRDTGAAWFSPAADGGAVGVLMTNDRPTVELVLGALATGARVVSLPLPGRAADLDDYVALLAHACEAHGLSSIVVADEHADLLAAAGLPARRHADLGGIPLAAPAPGGFELVQFTSGSTRRPRPVALDNARLGANVAAILEVLRPRPGDGLVSWLPLSHDMGLVGMLFTGLAAAAPAWVGESDLVLLDPRSFLRRPAVWLEALSRWGKTFTAAPDFAFRLAATRPPKAPLDLARLRCAIVGGEIVRADTLTAFASAFAGHGLDPLAFCPAYGMAELGVAATLTPPDEHWRATAVATVALAEGRVEPTPPQPGASTLVASGPALPGFGVTAGDPGTGAGTGAGRIAVRGPSLGAHGGSGAPFADPDGWYRTGDVGFLREDRLYVAGRDDDYLVARGRNLYAPAVEDAVAGLGGIRPGRVTALGLPSGDWVVVAEVTRAPLATGSAADELRHAVARRTVDVTAVRPDDVVLLLPGRMPLTASGKLQRNAVRARLLDGGLTG